MFFNEPISKGDVIYFNIQPCGPITYTLSNTDFLVASNSTTSVTLHQEEEKETAMSLEQNQIEYLTRRTMEVFRELRSPLADKYNLYKDNTPKTCKELIDTIKNDKFTLDEKRIKLLEADEDEEVYRRGPFDGIIWGGPQPDWDGYNAACEKLAKAREATLDIINTSPSSEGLKALREFQKWTP